MRKRTLIVARLLFLILFSCKKEKDDVKVNWDVKKFDGRYSITGTIVYKTEPRISAIRPRIRPSA